MTGASQLADNYWTFKRLSADECIVQDASGSVYIRSHGDLAAHRCQDYMRWTEPPNFPGGPEKEPFGLKPAN